MSINSQCPQSNYKYTCGSLDHVVTNTSDPNYIPEWYRRWKEVAVVPSGWAIKFRIRWASTDYLLSDSKEYFRIPEDQLIEYPGYVYHCHFLNHEDNKLMRAFQMLPSDKFDQNYPASPDLQKCLDECGLKTSDGWKARYICINRATGCSNSCS